jgi:hypothetical protein
LIEWITRYWIGAAFAGMLAAFGFGYRQLSYRVKENEAIKLGVTALLWNALYQIYNEAERRCEISVDALKNAKNIYDQYHALGGNGVDTELYQRLCALPTRKTKIAPLEKEEE